MSGAYTYDETKAIELAQSYSSEIKAKRFDENSPVGGVPPCDGVSGGNGCTANSNAALGPIQVNPLAQHLMTSMIMTIWMKAVVVGMRC